MDYLAIARKAEQAKQTRQPINDIENQDLMQSLLRMLWSDRVYPVLRTGQIQLASNTGEPIPEALTRLAAEQSSMMLEFLADWPTESSPGPCTACLCPIFRKSKQGDMLCCSCQEMLPAETSQRVHVISDFGGVAWEAFPPKA